MSLGEYSVCVREREDGKVRKDSVRKVERFKNFKVVNVKRENHSLFTNAYFCVENMSNRQTNNKQAIRNRI